MSDKELADQLDARDRLFARGYRQVPCQKCGERGFTEHSTGGVPWSYPCVYCHGHGYNWVAPEQAQKPASD